MRRWPTRSASIVSPSPGGRSGPAEPSLYKHVQGLDGLQQRIAVLAMAELGRAMADGAMGRATGDALRGLADRYRAYAVAHPGRYAATLRTPAADDEELTAGSEVTLWVAFAVLEGYGITGNDAIDATRMIRSALHGFVVLEAAGGFGMPQDVDRSFRRLVDALDHALEVWT